jgi:hypothetical protein
MDVLELEQEPLSKSGKQSAPMRALVALVVISACAAVGYMASKVAPLPRAALAAKATLPPAQPNLPPAPPHLPTVSTQSALVSPALEAPATALPVREEETPLPAREEEKPAKPDSEEELAGNRDSHALTSPDARASSPAPSLPEPAAQERRDAAAAPSPKRHPPAKPKRTQQASQPAQVPPTAAYRQDPALSEFMSYPTMRY